MDGVFWCFRKRNIGLACQVQIHPVKLTISPSDLWMIAVDAKFSTKFHVSLSCTRFVADFMCSIRRFSIVLVGWMAKSPWLHAVRICSGLTTLAYWHIRNKCSGKLLVGDESTGWRHEGKSEQGSAEPFTSDAGGTTFQSRVIRFRFSVQKSRETHQQDLSLSNLTSCVLESLRCGWSHTIFWWKVAVCWPFENLCSKHKLVMVTRSNKRSISPFSNRQARIFHQDSALDSNFQGWIHQIEMHPSNRDSVQNVSQPQPKLAWCASNAIWGCLHLHVFQAFESRGLRGDDEVCQIGMALLMWKVTL